MMRSKWTGPLVRVGDVPIVESTAEAVAFVCKEDISGIREPRGTAVFVAVLNAERTDLAAYLVTAWHVVQDNAPTWIRLRRRDEGPPDDLPIVSKWKKHPSADVAITPAQIDVSTYVHRAVPEEQFFDLWPMRYDSRVVPGDVVSFIGLLIHVESMAQRAIPMMRGGIIGALYQENVPLRDDLLGVVREEPCAHLIDCHSVGGFSGSPVFVEQPAVVGSPEKLAISGGNALLGLLIGHFPGAGAGIGIVVPIEAVRELLNLEVFVEDRRQRDIAAARRRQERKERNAGVQDAAAQAAEFERFEDLTRKLVQVPKKELDEKLKGERDN